METRTRQKCQRAPRAFSRQKNGRCRDGSRCKHEGGGTIEIEFWSVYAKTPDVQLGASVAPNSATTEQQNRIQPKKWAMSRRDMERCNPGAKCARNEHTRLLMNESKKECDWEIRRSGAAGLKSGADHTRGSELDDGWCFRHELWRGRQSEGSDAGQTELLNRKHGLSSKPEPWTPMSGQIFERRPLDFEPAVTDPR